MSSKIITRYLDEREFPIWDKFVARSLSGSIYSTAEYLDVLCGAAGGRFGILSAWRGDDLVGGIGVYEFRSRFGTLVKTRALLYYNGVVLSEHETKYPSQRTSRALEVVDALREVLDSASYRFVSLRNRSPMQDARAFQRAGWQVTPSYTYVVSLADTAVIWDRMEQNLRRLIKRCSAAGVEFSDDSDFDSFYTMHRQTTQRKGAALYLSEQAFRQYFEKLRALGLCRLFHARLPGGRSISSQLVLLGAHPVSHTVCAASDEESLKMGAAAFLRWKTFETLSKLGYAANDLTDAALNPVTHFKSQLGGDLLMTLMAVQPSLLSLGRDSLAYVRQVIRKKPKSSRPATHEQR